ncbi:MAG TPA: NUDIX domain-containing protein [Candidatus Binatia bacterium]|nr:NUDIX domain-containing protein [Candidatus Binatia bacterium]
MRAVAKLPDSPFRRRTPRVQITSLQKLSDCQQAAAVCYRLRDGEIEFLLVRTSAGRRWTFPKGRAERGLTHAQAAALEAFEEAGVHGRIEESAFARYRTHKRAGNSTVDVSAHLCEVRRLARAEESGRDRTWFDTEQTKVRLREGRDAQSGKQFDRLLDAAVQRIEKCHFAGRLRRLDGARGSNENLRKVQFEACGEVKPVLSTRLHSRPNPQRKSFKLQLDQPRLGGELLEFDAAKAGSRLAGGTRKNRILGSGS